MRSKNRDTLDDIGKFFLLLLLSAVFLTMLLVLVGCRATTKPTPARFAPPPPAETRGVAALSWPALSVAEAYRVDYGVGLSIHELTNSLVTGATNCVIPDLTSGQRYLFQVRGIVSAVNQFGQEGKMYSKPISLGVFEAQ